MKKKQMSFLDHLEALRWHLIRIFLSIVICAAALFVFQKQVYDYFLLAHLDKDFTSYRLFCKFFGYLNIESNFCNLSFPNKLQSLALTTQLMNVLWTCLILGFVIAFPYIIWELWKFVRPALHKNEIQKSRGGLFVVSLLFGLGVLFSYYVICPMSVYFFYNYSITDTIQNNFTLTSYISLITNTLLGVSLVFELPVVIYFLAKLGLVTPEILKKYRKMALVIVLVLSAIITPPDVASQIIVSIPIIILYEFSIFIAKLVVKKQRNSTS